MTRHRTFLLIAALAGASCASAPRVDPAALAYAPALGIDLATAQRVGGIYINEKAAGSGAAAAAASEVTLHYTLYLPDGTQLQTTRGGEPLTVRLDDESFVIRRAVVGMRAGGRRVLVVPPERGYGREGVPGLVPPNATIVFDVERVR